MVKDRDSIAGRGERNFFPSHKMSQTNFGTKPASYSVFTTIFFFWWVGVVFFWVKMYNLIFFFLVGFVN
jgi:hypothetical protein